MPVVLGAYALRRRDGSFTGGLQRAVEQFAKLVPRMLCALIAAGFVAKLIPTDLISRFLGADAGVLGVVIGACSGILIPAGPFISFSIAATFASDGASTPALVAFITAWSVFALHRMVIYEIPLLGLSFVRLRLISVFLMPLIAGMITLGAEKLLAVLAAAGPLQ